MLCVCQQRQRNECLHEVIWKRFTGNHKNTNSDFLKKLQNFIMINSCISSINFKTNEILLNLLRSLNMLNLRKLEISIDVNGFKYFLKFKNCTPLAKIIHLGKILSVFIFYRQVFIGKLPELSSWTQVFLLTIEAKREMGDIYFLYWNIWKSFSSPFLWIILFFLYFNNR